MQPARLAATALATLAVLAVLLIGEVVTGPVVAAVAPERTIGGLVLIGHQVLPRRPTVDGTVVGGLSGIERDPADGRYLLVTDDRSDTDSPHPARLYRATLAIDERGFHGVVVDAVIPLLTPDGTPYPKLPRPGTPDPEGLRIDPVSGHVVWVSEGDRRPDVDPPRLTDPFVHEVDRQGRHRRAYALPPMFRMSAEPRGPRLNMAFEGVTFTPDGRRLAVLMEGALIEDGPVPTTAHGSRVRITLFDRASGRAVAQHLVPVDPVREPPRPADGFALAGPTELLALSSTRFLMLERSFSAGASSHRVLLVEIDIRGATNVLQGPIPPDAVAASRRTLLDFSTLEAVTGPIANLEGLAWGPRLAGGRETLVVVGDDNFPTSDSPVHRNQFLVFEVTP